MMRRFYLLITTVFCCSWYLLPAFAVLPDEIITDNPVLEQRAREISSHLRCLVCQNESIDDSSVPLARELRLLVRERLKDGNSDQQVTNFLVARYGEFVLLKPRLKADTILLWFAPILIILIAGGIIFLRVRRKARTKILPLTDDEKKQLDKLLKS